MHPNLPKAWRKALSCSGLSVGRCGRRACFVCVYVCGDGGWFDGGVCRVRGEQEGR